MEGVNPVGGGADDMPQRPNPTYGIAADVGRTPTHALTDGRFHSFIKLLRYFVQSPQVQDVL